VSSAILSPIVTEPTTVGVLPAETVIATWDTKYDDLLAVQLENLDPTQTFSGKVQRKLHDDVDWADYPADYFNTLAAGATVAWDVDVRATRAMRVVGSMDGAGGDVRVTAVRRAATR
jgi:hypothetical protein